MQGATNGDFTHGLIHPEQMIGGRLLVAGLGARDADRRPLSVRRVLSPRARA